MKLKPSFLFILLFLPMLAQAGYVVKPFYTPSGFLVWAIQIVEIDKVHAAELSLKEIISNYHDAVAILYNIDSDETKVTNQCESGWKTNPERAITVFGDWGDSYDIAPFQWKTFDMWKKESGMKELKYDQWRDALKLQAWAFSHGKTYKKHWTCWRKLYQP